MAVRQPPLTVAAVVARSAAQIGMGEIIAERAVVDAVVRLATTAVVVVRARPAGVRIASAVGRDALALGACATDFPRAALFVRRALAHAARLRRRLLILALLPIG